MEPCYSRQQTNQPLLPIQMLCPCPQLAPVAKGLSALDGLRAIEYLSHRRRQNSGQENALVRINGARLSRVHRRKKSISGAVSDISPRPGTCRSTSLPTSVDSQTWTDPGRRTVEELTDSQEPETCPLQTVISSSHGMPLQGPNRCRMCSIFSLSSRWRSAGDISAVDMAALTLPSRTLSRTNASSRALESAWASTRGTRRPAGWLATAATYQLESSCEGVCGG